MQSSEEVTPDVISRMYSIPTGTIVTQSSNNQVTKEKGERGGLAKGEVGGEIRGGGREEGEKIIIRILDSRGVL